MELEDMQQAWQAMSRELDTQKQLTETLIMNMIKEKHRARWNTMAQFERLGAVICYAAVIYLVIQFERFDTPALQVAAGVVIFILSILPWLSLRSIRRMSQLDILQSSYTKVMKTYATRKREYLNFQKWNIVLSFILMLLAVPVAGKVSSGKDLFAHFEPKLWFALPFGLLFLGGMIFYVSRVNRSLLQKTEALLAELNQSDA